MNTLQFPSHWSRIRKLLWLKILSGASAVWSTITGNPVSFTAKAAPLRKLEVAFSPVQNLHGYDAPWPAGGGKNKFDPSAATVGINWNGNAMAYSIASDYIPVEVGKRYVISVADMPKYTGVTVAFLDASKDYVTNGNTTTFDVTDGIAFIRISFRCANTDTWTESDLSAAKIQVEQSATATSYAPYSNICPISGWDKVGLRQRGTNLFDEEWELGGISNHTGENVESTSNIRTKNFIPVKGGGISIGWDTTSAGSVYGLIMAYKADKTFSRYVGAFSSPSQRALNANECYIRFYIYGRTTALPDAFVHLPVNFGEPYVPYNPSSRSISINLGQTVYSGYVDVVTGVGEITHTAIVADGVNVKANRGYEVASKDVFGAGIVYVSPEGVSGAGKTVIADTLKVSANTLGEMQIAIPNNGKLYTIFYVGFISEHPEITTNQQRIDFTNAWLQQNPTTICYELATPIPIQLTPQEVESLLGDNVMWSDANGDLTVEYRSN